MNHLPIQILLIGNDGALQTAVQAALHGMRAFQFSLSRAENAGPAMVHIHQQSVDIILLDWDSAGIEATAAIQTFRDLAACAPVIILAEAMDDAMASGAIANGVYNCLPKPNLRQDLGGLILYLAGRKQAEEELSREKHLLRALIDHLPSLVFVKDAAGRYVVSNRAHTAFLNAIDEQEVLGKTAADFFPPELARMYHKDDQAIMASGQPVVEREEPQASGDSITWHATTKVPLRDRQGNVTGLIGVKQDITARKETEASLRRAEERYRSIFINAVEGIFQSTPEGRYLDVNPAFARILGYDSPAEVVTLCTDIGRQVYVNPEDRLRFTSLLSEKGLVTGMEHEAWRKDRTKVWLSLNGRAVRDSEGHIRHYEGSIEDITEKKRAESEIRHLAAFPRHNPNPVYEFAPEGALKYFNEAAAALAASLGDREAAAILPKNIAAIVQCCWTEERSLRRLETRHGERIISWSFFPIRAVGTVHCYAGEITDYKRAQEALRQSEERYQLAMRGLSAGLWDWNLVSNEIFFAPRFKTLLGYEENEEMPAELRSFSGLVHPEDSTDLKSLLEAHLSGATSRLDIECRLRTRTGDYQWFHISGLALRNESGTFHRMAGSITDVTDRKQDEERLRISEERFRLLARATNDAIWDWDLNTDLVWWNEGYEYLFGYRRDEIEPRIDSWTRRIHPEDYPRIHQQVRALLNGMGTSWTGEYRFLCRDGSYTYVLDRGYIIRDETGRAIRMIGGMTDLSDRKAAEEKLAQQAALLDHASDAIIVNDLTDRTIYWNRSAERLYGWTASEATGRSCSELIGLPPEKSKSIREEVLRQGHAYTELCKRSKDGREILVETRWSLMRNAVGEPQYLLSINTDVTERRRLEQHFLRSQRMESIGTLAGGIAHDLNNVLAPILMGISMLKEEKNISAEAGHVLETLSTSAERGAALIRQVLSFARGVQGQRVKLNLSHIVRDVRAIVAETFPKTVQFQTSLPQDLWVVTGDPTNIHQVILNLCVNARDAMPNGGKLAVILRNHRLDAPAAAGSPELAPGNYVVIEVSDTGEGIPDVIRHKIFEPFFTTKETGRGTGLGLSTSLGIVKSHGGSITVDSQPGKGSTFQVHLPADPGASELRAPKPLPPKLPAGEGRLILVVDDEPAIRLVATKILENGGYRVMVASNGAEGLALYQEKQHQIAAVITDMNMPILDGPSLIAAMHRLNPSVRVIGTSGLGSDSDLFQAVQLQAKAFITKPYSVENLLQTVHEVITAP